MKTRSLASARFHASRMDPKDDPRIFERQWSVGGTEYLVCANDVRPRSGGWVEAHRAPGEPVMHGEFQGTVVRLYSDGPNEASRMYEVKLPGGLVCVCGSDLKDARAQ